MLIALGNRVMTRYAYDPHTFRLRRLRSELYTQPGSLTYQPAGGLLQDFAYAYDLVGNILAIHDRLPGSGVLPQPDALDRVFGYDAIYRQIFQGRGARRPPTRRGSRRGPAYGSFEWWEQAARNRRIQLEAGYHRAQAAQMQAQQQL